MITPTDFASLKWTDIENAEPKDCDSNELYLKVNGLYSALVNGKKQIPANGIRDYSRISKSGDHHGDGTYFCDDFRLAFTDRQDYGACFSSTTVVEAPVTGEEINVYVFGVAKEWFPFCSQDVLHFSAENLETGDKLTYRDPSLLYPDADRWHFSLESCGVDGSGLVPGYALAAATDHLVEVRSETPFRRLKQTALRELNPSVFMQYLANR